MKQYIYHADMLTKNYLASYAEAHISNNKLFLINTLTDRQVIIEGKKEFLYELLLSLNKGTSDKNLKLLLAKYNLEKVFETLLQEGVVE